MATPESVAIRRADALARVAAAIDRIAAATGAEIAPFPDAHKRHEMRPLVEADWLADALEAVANAVTGEGGETAGNEDGGTVDLDATPSPKMSRTDLDAIAAAHGIDDTSDYRTKADLIAAIDAKVWEEQNVTDPKQPAPEPDPTPEPEPTPEPTDDETADDGANDGE